MIATLPEIALTRVLPWKQTRLYQIVRGSPELLEEFGLRVITRVPVIQCFVENEEIKLRILRIRQLLRHKKKGRHPKRYRIKVNIPFEWSYAINQTFDYFLTYINHLPSEIISSKLKHTVKKKISLPEDTFIKIREIAKREKVTVAQVMKTLIESYLLEVFPDLYSHLKEVQKNGSNDSYQPAQKQ